MSKNKIAWVLGAGFSAPLGGPMLKDLFSLALHHEVSAMYKFTETTAYNPDVQYMDDVMWLYHYGRRFEQGRLTPWITSAVGNFQEPGEILWDHAEQFLEFLDSTFGSEVKRKRCLDIINLNPRRIGNKKLGDPLEVRKAARRHLAGEVSYFLRDDTFERRLPYDRWANEVVGDEDVIITFNYDCVLERLHTVTETSSSPGRIKVLDSESLGTWPSGPKALKLHGGTSWVWERDANDDWIVVTKYPEYAVRSYLQDEAKVIEAATIYVGTKENRVRVSVPRHAYKKGEQAPGYLKEGGDVDLLVMATPGPSKYNNRSLKLWWDKASEFIKDADAIVFIGYRFPPSDTHALKELLTAIAGNSHPRLRLHTVLGPSLDDATVRLEQLLNYSAKSKDPTPIVEIHRLWAQDFMTVVRRCDLVG